MYIQIRIHPHNLKVVFSVAGCRDSKDLLFPHRGKGYECSDELKFECYWASQRNPTVVPEP